MNDDCREIKFCINLAIDNAEERIKLLEKSDQKCILEEYKEWLKESIDCLLYTSPSPRDRG